MTRTYRADRNLRGITEWCDVELFYFYSSVSYSLPSRNRQSQIRGPYRENLALGIYSRYKSSLSIEDIVSLNRDASGVVRMVGLRIGLT